MVEKAARRGGFRERFAKAEFFRVHIPALKAGIMWGCAAGKVKGTWLRLPATVFPFQGPAAGRWLSRGKDGFSVSGV